MNKQQDPADEILPVEEAAARVFKEKPESILNVLHRARKFAAYDGTNVHELHNDRLLWTKMAAGGGRRDIGLTLQGHKFWKNAFNDGPIRVKGLENCLALHITNGKNDSVEYVRFGEFVEWCLFCGDNVPKEFAGHVLDADSFPGISAPGLWFIEQGEPVRTADGW